MSYRKPKTLLKNIQQKRLTRKSAFLKKLEKSQAEHEAKLKDESDKFFKHGKYAAKQMMHIDWSEVDKLHIIALNPTADNVSAFVRKVRS